jgi:hypothetical protein
LYALMKNCKESAFSTSRSTTKYQPPGFNHIIV